MKVLLTGRGGQLGQALIASAPPGIALIATGRQELDLSDPEACSAAVRDSRPDWVLNAGAYTAVDQAESEPVLAHAVNAGAPAAFAQALAQTGGRMLQLSTDFVFNGAQGHPYQVNQQRAPLGVYGTSKAAGEQAVVECLGGEGDERAAILRTSWVYGPVGRNFLLTMLRLHRLKAEAQESLCVVEDQVGCPTATPGLAQACWSVIQQQVTGLHHWSDAGAASWYDFAVAIGELAVARGLMSDAAAVQPISTADYPTPAQRPSYSLLECSVSRRRLGLPAQHWRSALQDVIASLDG
ncbi:MAG: dTDP-4-dehydrorhamnose reductase [Rhodopirellula sp. TMED11]|nr:MAG: dTDP-4-dehydrorhamnose reductase [Rhodopirellula sp. TMED11]